MPRSIFLGRPWPTPGEELFTQEDTDWAIALAEEERDTCPSCGMPKAWCRDPAYQFAFEPHEEQCHATYALAAHRNAVSEGRSDEQRAAIRPAARFRSGFTPDMAAGLDIEVDEDPTVASEVDGA